MGSASKRCSATVVRVPEPRSVASEEGTAELEDTKSETRSSRETAAGIFILARVRRLLECRGDTGMTAGCGGRRCTVYRTCMSGRGASREERW